MFQNRHTPCIKRMQQRISNQEADFSPFLVRFSTCGVATMTSIARKQAIQLQGATVREQLHAMDDSGVVTAFLGGEERAFSELVERYQTRLLNFVYRTIGAREKAEDLVQE